MALPSLAATRKLAKSLAQRLQPGEVLALVGGLGTGKTTLTQALARALEVKEPREVLSPTYTLVNEHFLANGTTLVHLDLYRLIDTESAVALGIVEQLDRRDAIVVVEWADRFPELVPKHAIWLTLRIDESGKRTATLGRDSRW